MSSTWKFPTQKSGRTSYHTIPTEKAFDSELSTFVREVLQNANDQGISDTQPAQVFFRFQRLTGDDLREYLETLQWESKLRKQLQLATENEQVRDPGLQQFLNEFDGDELVILTIEDRNTTGLEGAETDESKPYGSLVKDFGGTNKPDESSGGSHGVGKTVLWAFSGVSTVLFNSKPRTTPEHGQTPPRLVGRSVLPARDHETDDNLSYTNEGWFGLDHVGEIDRLGRPPSIWDDDGSSSLAEKLHVDRETGATGTSIGIVGFRIPGESINPDLEEVSEEIREAAATYFWPAMSRDELEVYVETPESGQEKVDSDAAPSVAPFMQTYEEQFSVEESDVLEEPGDIVHTTVDVTIPKENSEAVESPHGEIETSADLFVRQVTPAEHDILEEGIGLNTVARFRGAQMVVDYVSAERAASRDRDFIALLVCGEAQAEPGTDPTPEQAALEQFLKRSEPTQHDDWIGSGNDYLKKHYSGTIVKEIRNLGGERLMAAIEGVVRDSDDPDRRVKALDEFMPSFDEGVDESGSPGPSVKAAFDWPTQPNPTFDGERWSFDATVEPTEEFDRWDIRGKLVELDDDEKEVDQVDIDRIYVSPDVHGISREVVDGEIHVTIEADVDSVSIEAESVPVPDKDFETGVLSRTKAKIRGIGNPAGEIDEEDD
ncbi:hypothetical protein [Halolamina litorea]|uniref:ATP-binding protein n=1 Tax=Halolamina litorea TaxID=1515593 RepID=A0ABD6BLQ4_9EURY|nr:hypothetical protein [Halolamina litorea]